MAAQKVTINKDSVTFEFNKKVKPLYGVGEADLDFSEFSKAIEYLDTAWITINDTALSYKGNTTAAVTVNS